MATKLNPDSILDRSITNAKLNIGEPVDSSDVVIKSYVDGLIGDIDTALNTVLTQYVEDDSETLF